MFLSIKYTIITLLKYRYFGSLLSDYVPTLDNDTFAITKTQPSNMQGDLWNMIANSRYKMYFVNSVGRPSFFKQQSEQVMPEPLQCHSSICSLYVTYAAFYLLKFRQETIYWSAWYYFTFFYK